MINGRNNLSEVSKISFLAGKFKNEQKENIKILGYLLNNKLNHQTYFNSIISKVNLRAYTAGLISKYMSLQTKRIVFTALIISIIRYSALLIINVNAKQLKILNVLINKIGRKAMGFQIYKWSNNKLMQNCKWLNGTHILVYSTLNLIHKVNILGQPKQIINLMKFREKGNSRFVRALIEMKYVFKNEKLNATTLYKGILLYLKIPENLKSLNLKKFKIAIKKYIETKMPLDRINTYRDYS